MLSPTFIPMWFQEILLDEFLQISMSCVGCTHLGNFLGSNLWLDTMKCDEIWVIWVTCTKEWWIISIIAALANVVLLGPNHVPFVSICFTYAAEIILLSSFDASTCDLQPFFKDGLNSLRSHVFILCPCHMPVILISNLSSFDSFAFQFKACGIWWICMSLCNVTKFNTSKGGKFRSPLRRLRPLHRRARL